MEFTASPSSSVEISSAIWVASVERIAELLGKAGLQPTMDPRTRARLLRRFVYRYVNAKSLGVGFGSASEVARTRAGDCTEHAVLLAALLRADGIPSRVVSGLIYAERFEGRDDILGYHMWTQAWLTSDDGEPGWFDFDATLGGDRPTDATHIALDISTLDDGEAVNSMLRLTPMIGRLNVSVESFE
ncbi:MAG: transglutaminase-like domain-containing protein, partial [Planctomycetota bacterium]